MDRIPNVVWVALGVVVLCLLIAGLFVVDVGSSDHQPVPYDDTVSMGIALEDELALESDVVIPRVQVFYSQYQYIVGYDGVETFVTMFNQPAHDQQFGYPLSIFVTDFSGTDVTLDEDGYPTSDRFAGWTDGQDAHYVVGSGARTPAGETVVPFSNREEAETFATEYGGTVRSWEGVLEEEFEVDGADRVRDRVADQHADADAMVAASSELRDRPTTLVVGEDAETVQEAVDEAPENSTVVVPEGTYDELVEINQSITLAGEPGAHVRGDDNSTVITVNADDVAITGLSIDGVGDTAMDTAAHGTDDWDSSVETSYGTGDAGIRVENASSALIEDVEIETPANGVLLRNSPDTVVRSITVQGHEEWREGYMGVVTMRSPAVIEDSTFVNGRDGVYTHYSHGLVVRDNEMLESRIGVHLMHTSDVLIADNRIEDQVVTGIDVMTEPTGNAMVGNDIRNAGTGILVRGGDSYVADNVLVGNNVGVTTDADNSIYEGNVLAENDIGARASSTLPTNRVTENSFVGNDEHVEVSAGPLRVWTHEHRGNYWEGAVGTTSGTTIDRTYTPTDPVDSALHTVDGTPTLAQSLALETQSELAGMTPGMREGSVIDTAPLCESPTPTLLEAADIEYESTACQPPATD